MHSKKRDFFSLLIVSVLLCSFFSLLPVSAYSYETVSADTGNIDLIAGVKIRIDCSFRVSGGLGNTKLEPGETISKLITINDGSMTVNVYIPSPVNSWYSATKSFTFLQELTNINIPIIEFVSANIRLVPTATFTTIGPASVSPSKINFDRIGPDYDSRNSKEYIIMIDSSAQGSRVAINHVFSVELIAGVNIGMSLFSTEIASTSLGSFSMSPTIPENIDVSHWYESWLNTLLSPFLVLPAIFLMFILTFFIVTSKIRKRKEIKTREEQLKNISKRKTEDTTYSNQRKSQDSVPKRLDKKSYIFCIFCGAELPSKAVFCRKCGKNQKS